MPFIIYQPDTHRVTFLRIFIVVGCVTRSCACCQLYLIAWLVMYVLFDVTVVTSQLVAARERLGKPCDMCKNYESQLQQLQRSEKSAQAQVGSSS